jgi:2-oxo-4-hydroxy-4-carboxy-5-ureidoimidazoline decarboxylase
MTRDASRSSWLNHASDDDARDFLTTCCGSTRWVAGMLAERPFANDDHLLTAARRIWFALTPADWREAFAHHPKIGDVASLRARFAGTAQLSAAEQQGVASASEATLRALAQRNRDYEQKFGYIFIVCATGKSADEMLAILEQRLDHGPATELRTAAAELAAITALRLLRPT